MDAETFLKTLRPEILNPEEHIDLPWLNQELDRLGVGIVPLSRFIEDGEQQDLLDSPQAMEIIDLLLGTRLLATQLRRGVQATPSALAQDDRWLQQALRAMQQLLRSEEFIEKSLEILITGSLLNRLAAKRVDKRRKKFVQLVRQAITDAMGEFGEDFEVVFEQKKILSDRLSRGYVASILYQQRRLIVVHSMFLTAAPDFGGRDIEKLIVDQATFAREGVNLLAVADGIGFRQIVKTVNEVAPKLRYFTNLSGLDEMTKQVVEDGVSARKNLNISDVEDQYAAFQRVASQQLRQGTAVTPQLVNLPETLALEYFARYRVKYDEYSFTTGNPLVLEASSTRTLKLANEQLQSLTNPGSTDSSFIMSLIADHMGYQFDLVTRNRGFDLFGLHLPEGRLQLSRPFPVAILTGSSSTDRTASLTMLDSELSEGKIVSQIALVIAITNIESARLAARRIALQGKTQFSIIERDEVFELLLRSPTQAQRYLMRLLLANIDLNKVAPFQVDGAVTDARFYGRDLEIRQITEGIRNRSFALMGGRKAGKTSILQRLSSLLPQHHKVIYLDCQFRNNRESLLRHLIERTPTDLRIVDEPDVERSDDILRAFIQSEFGDGFGVLLIDEVDNVFADDARSPNHRHLFSSVLRSLSQTRRATVVMTGERVLSELAHDPSSPHWNFATKILVGPLQDGAARELIQTPIEEIGLRISKESIQLALQQTANHPNLLQEIGSRLVESASFANPTIEVSSVDVTAATPAYRTKFVETFWSQATVLEKYISVQLQVDTPLSLDAIAQRLATAKIHMSLDELKQALAFLELYAIIRQAEAGYVLTAPAFAPYFAQEATPFVRSEWERSLR